ncbi:MAG: class I SAM-dependent methyltransferase [Patescibacteria group bacterium]|nr:class I SAM-dependent methyltransferase [Nanoarchaeota archaeon]
MNYKFLKPIHYEKSPAFIRFLKYSGEKAVTSNTIIKTFKPRRDWNFMDVGCGTGEVTVPIAKLVNRTTVIEPSLMMLKEFKKNAKSISNIKIIRKKIEEVNLKEEFDFILISHLLYFIKDWDKLFDKLLHSLKKCGYLVIILHAKSGSYYNFLTKFQKLIDENIVIWNYLHAYKILKDKGLKPKNKIVKSSIVIPSIKEALNLCPFFFEVPLNKLDKSIKEKMLNYFKLHQKNNNVVLNSIYGIVWIKKQL